MANSKGKAKTSSQSREKKLPDRYPRSKEILIFQDMGELDHINEEIENIGSALNELTTPDSPYDKWEDVLDGSPINGVIRFLRIACIEYERFWQDEKWNYEEDADYKRYMHDSHDLHYLVCELEQGRIEEDKNGKPIKTYQPAYHAVARSLEMAMLLVEMPGDKDRVDYCIKELKFYLNRYHAASLEVVFHRNNVYLSNNSKNIVMASKSRERSIKHAKQQKKDAEKRAEKALTLFKELWENKKDHELKTTIVIKVAENLAVSESTVWRYLGGEEITKK